MSATLDADMRVLARGASAWLAWLSVELHTRSRALGVDRVLFMTREGLLFKPYYEQFSALQAGAPAAELLQVSRLSTFAASLHGSGVAGLSRLFNPYPQAGWTELLASLGEPHADLPLLPGRGAALGQALAEDARASAWLEAVAARRHAELAAYLQAHHRAALQAGRVLVVDIGWRGTIQDNLAQAFPAVHWEGVYLGLHDYLSVQPPNTGKQGLLFEPGRPGPGAGAGAGANLMPIEYLFHQAVGTVSGYRDGAVQTLPSAGREDAFSCAFQQAVLADAAHRAAEWARPDTAATLAAWREQAQAFWDGCQRMPLPLFQALCGYAHEETFGLGQVVHMALAMSPAAALRSLVSRQHRALFLQYVGALPLALRHEPGLGPWLRAWLHVRHAQRWLRSRPRT